MEIGTISDGSVIKIKLGFLITIFGSVIGLVTLFVVMRQDLLDGLKRITVLEQLHVADTAQLTDMRLKLTSIDDNIFYFRQQYEIDNPLSKRRR